MLSEMSTQILTTLHPTYALLNTDFSVSDYGGVIQYSNVPNLDNEDIFNLAVKDVNVEDSIVVMKQRKYQGYVNWFYKQDFKDDNNEPLLINLRLSSHKLDTKSMTEQYIMLTKKYHPFVEDINRFVLIIEVLLNKKSIIYFKLVLDEWSAGCLG